MKKRSITLLEILIVIFLIGIIASVVGYNMKSSLDKGKDFKTTQAKERIRDILLLEAANGSKPLSEVVANYKSYLADSGLVKDVESLCKDGYGKELVPKLSKDGKDLEVVSK